MSQSNLSITTKELRQMTDEQLGELQRSLGQFLGTPQEQQARLLNTVIYDERGRRQPYGFRRGE